MPAWIEPQLATRERVAEPNAGQAQNLSECVGSSKRMAELADDFAGNAEQVALAGISGRRAARRAT